MNIKHDNCNTNAVCVEFPIAKLNPPTCQWSVRACACVHHGKNSVRVSNKHEIESYNDKTILYAYEENINNKSPMSPMLNLLYDGSKEEREKRRKMTQIKKKMKNKKTRMIDLNTFKIKYYTVVIFGFFRSLSLSLCLPRALLLLSKVEFCAWNGSGSFVCSFVFILLVVRLSYTNL